MERVSASEADALLMQGKILVPQKVLGHMYGISATAVRQLQVAGKLPVLDLDRVEDVEQLRTQGFQVWSCCVSCTCPHHTCPGWWGLHKACKSQSAFP
jgi:guanylate kinase